LAFSLSLPLGASFPQALPEFFFTVTIDQLAKPGKLVSEASRREMV